jgi:hypothetical protein
MLKEIQDNATLLSELEALRKAGSGNTDELEDVSSLVTV